MYTIYNEDSKRPYWIGGLSTWAGTNDKEKSVKLGPVAIKKQLALMKKHQPKARIKIVEV